MTLGKAEEDEIEAHSEMIPLPSNDCIVLGECRKVVFQEVYLEMSEKCNMPIVAY